MQSLVVEIQEKKVLIDINSIHAVSRISSPLTIIPHTGQSILGATNFRGKFVPIYNLNAVLNFEPNWGYFYLVVLQREGKLVGVLSEKLPVIGESDKPEFFSLDKIFKKG